MSVDDWVFRFLHSFRFEAKKLTKEQTVVFEPLKKEQMLTEPCQVEVIQFSVPYRFLLLCFFDKTKQDAIIRTHQLKWSSLNTLIKNLIKSYSELELSRRKLSKIPLLFFGELNLECHKNKLSKKITYRNS